MYSTLCSFHFADSCKNIIWNFRISEDSSRYRIHFFNVRLLEFSSNDDDFRHSNSQTTDLISPNPLISIEECIESNAAHPSLFQSDNSIRSSVNGLPFSEENMIDESVYSKFTDERSLLD